MYAADNSIRDRGLKIGRQQEGIPHDESPVTGLHQIAVTQRGVRKIFAPEELDQRHIAAGIHPHDDRVVQYAVIQTTLHEVADTVGDVEVGQGKSVRRDQHARTAAGTTGSENRDDRGSHFFDDRNPLLLRTDHDRVCPPSELGQHDQAAGYQHASGQQEHGGSTWA